MMHAYLCPLKGFAKFIAASRNGTLDIVNRNDLYDERTGQVKKGAST